MNWRLSEAKDGKLTLLLNDIYLYSKYHPYEDAARWVEKEFDSTKTNYLLIGLGLGYHVTALVEKTNKPIWVYYFNEIEKEYAKANINYSNVRLTNNIQDILEDTQVLIPMAFLKAIGASHPLFSVLEDFKIKQASFQRQKKQMSENFKANIMLNDKSLTIDKSHNTACLVSAGPSLNETISWLATTSDKVDIFVVGAAYRVLEKHGIIPKAVITADADITTLQQFQGINNYSPFLIYLSTANHNVVRNYRGERQIVFQEGFDLAEEEAIKRNVPCIYTGGSVATVGFSIIDSLNYDKLILFGQDLAYGNEQFTHAIGSTSLRRNNTTLKRKVLSNNGILVETTVGLSIFLQWFNKQCINTKMKVYNTAHKGAKIDSTIYIDEEQYYIIVNKFSSKTND